MSINTWKEEFYPELAQNSAYTELAAVKHSVLKWKGLQVDALKKHEVVFGLSCIEDVDGGFLKIDGKTCALCRRHVEYKCLNCSLYIVRGEASCDNLCSDEKNSPWELRKQNPEIMLRWLEKALEYVENAS